MSSLLIFSHHCRSGFAIKDLYVYLSFGEPFQLEDYRLGTGILMTKARVDGSLSLCLRPLVSNHFQAFYSLWLPASFLAFAKGTHFNGAPFGRSTPFIRFTLSCPLLHPPQAWTGCIAGLGWRMGVCPWTQSASSPPSNHSQHRFTSLWVHVSSVLTTGPMTVCGWFCHPIAHQIYPTPSPPI